MSKHDDFAWPSQDLLLEWSLAELPWQYYLQTAVQFVTPDHRGTVSPVPEGKGQVSPPLGALHVVTAVQPDTEPDSPDNRARLALLDQELTAMRMRFLEVTGASLDGNHREDSRAVFGLDDARARELGKLYGQIAVFSWRGPRWSLLACVGSRTDHRGWVWIPRG
jgi:hypothetical protein